MDNLITLKKHKQNIANGVYEEDPNQTNWKPSWPDEMNAIVGIKYFDPKAPRKDGGIGKWYYGYCKIKNYFINGAD